MRNVSSESIEIPEEEERKNDHSSSEGIYREDRKENANQEHQTDRAYDARAHDAFHPNLFQNLVGGVLVNPTYICLCLAGGGIKGFIQLLFLA